MLRTTTTFAQLHQAIQESFGWQESHLWEFRLPTYQGHSIAGLPEYAEFGPPPPDAKTIKLNTYFTGKRGVEWCEYLYDFGDSWTHNVKLIAVHPEGLATWLGGWRPDAFDPMKAKATFDR